MTESSSDTESSCGWTVISNEGSDIETLGPENAVEFDTEEAGGASAPIGESSTLESCLDDTLKEEEKTALEAEPEAQGDPVTLCSLSDHSDIVTLADAKEAELGTWEEPVARVEEQTNEELYMGSSSSSQYTFSASETKFPVEPPVRRSSSSSTEDEDVEVKAGQVVRRRRLRKSTTGSEPEPGEQNELEEGDDNDEGGDGDDQDVMEEQREAQIPQQSSGSLNKCIILTLIVAISMGFGHFYGTVQIQERHKMMMKTLFYDSDEEQLCQKKDALDEDQAMVVSLTGIMDKITKENLHLKAEEAKLQAQRQDLLLQLQQTKNEMDSRQKHLALENRALKSTLEREEASLSALQAELRHLRAQIRDLEEKGTGADSILSENQRLKGHLLEEKQKIRNYLSQKEVLMVEAQALRKELDRERKVTDKLRDELEEMSQQGDGEVNLETEELQSRLRELEKKLSFEQQRSDLWERLYVESKDPRAKGDTQPKARKSKEGMLGKVQETFDAMKNSTKEFVHHHKEQIKKAKEAVKENFRKFSDSVKSTFRQFKDSTSNVFDRLRRPHEKRFNERKDATTNQQDFQQDFKRFSQPHWQHQQPPHQHPRKSTADSRPHTDQSRHRSGSQKEHKTRGRNEAPKGCTGVFDCAYQESMSLFNKVMEPIRADEFHQLLRRYLQQQVEDFHHWTELDNFINDFFHNGLFIHDQMLFTDFVSGVEDYLEDMGEYQSEGGVFEDLDDYIYRHFFGETYTERYGPSRPLEDLKVKPQRDCQRQQRKHRVSRPPPPRDRKWARSSRGPDRHFADVKIELGPMPFDPKY